MNPQEYQRLALRSQADQNVILLRLLQGGTKLMQLDNAVRGLCDDCGEVAGAVKKYIEYGQQLDLGNLLEEVGDCLWRLAQVCDAAGLDLGQAMEANIRKLKARYPEGYKDELAREENRDRTNEALAMRVSGSSLGHTDVIPQPEDVKPLLGKKCENCEYLATRTVYDESRDGRVRVAHHFCRDHDRQPKVLPRQQVSE